MYVVYGFNPLTLPASSFCFMKLCEKNAQDLLQFSNELAAEVLKPDQVATWKYEDCYADIMIAFGSLVSRAAVVNPQ